MSDRMHRTQIYLPEELNQALDELARRRGTTKAELVRRAAQRLVDEELSPEQDPIWGIVGLGEGRGGNVSEEHDRYLSEAEVSRWKRRGG